MFMKYIFHFVLLPKKEEAGRLCREKLAENEEAVSQGARGRVGGRRLWLRAACHGLQYVFLHSFLKTQSQTRCFFTTFTIKNWNFEVVYPVFDTSIWYWKDLWIYDIWERAYIYIYVYCIRIYMHVCICVCTVRGLSGQDSRALFGRAALWRLHLKNHGRPKKGLCPFHTLHGHIQNSSTYP